MVKFLDGATETHWARSSETLSWYGFKRFSTFSRPDGFQKFKRRLEAEKILHNLYRTDFQFFVLVKFFHFQFFLNLEFQTHKIHLESFLFEGLFIEDHC